MKVKMMIIQVMMEMMMIAKEMILKMTNQRKAKNTESE